MSEPASERHPDSKLPVGLPVDATPAPPDAAVVRRVERLLADPGLGPSVHAVVAPLADPAQPWTEVDADSAATPASTLKLWTAAATLDAFAPTDRISTTVAWDETTRTLVLVGGGDATLRTDADRADAGTVSHAASLSALARQVVRELGSEVDRPVRLDFDTSLFSGPAVSPDWEPTYVTSGVIAPVTALMTDYGMVAPPLLARYADPALAATETFADLLTERGLEVSGRHASVDVDQLPQTDEIAAVFSPQIGDLVEQMLRNSDNQLAEALGRLAAGSEGLPLSFSGAGRVIELAAQARGVDTGEARVFDASGLSRDDRFPATGLVEALHSAVDDPGL